MVGTPAAPLAHTARAADWSPRGRPITLIVPFAAGGTTDVGARLLAAAMERELATSVQVVNKPGATTQIGATELARARPDGFTLGLMSMPSLSMTYLDTERRAPYNRASFTPIAHFIADANMLAVQSAGRFRSAGDLVTAARAEPRRIRVGTVGLMSNAHLPGVALERVAGVRFAFVHFNGAAPAIAALLGGNVDAVINGSQSTLPQERGGALRAIGTFGPERSPFFPDAPTLIEQGFDVSQPSAFALLGPAGLPAEVVATLTATVKRAADSEEVRRRMTDLALTVRYMDPTALAAYWAEAEQRQRPLIELARQ